MLRGVNFSGLEYVGGHQVPVPMAVDYYLRQKRMNVVRLGLSWELIQPKLDGPLDQVVAGAVQLLIATIVAAGGTVIIELHNYGRRDGQIIGATPAVTLAHFSDVWKRIATMFQGPSVAYGIMNEPHDMDDDLVIAMVNAGIAGIRVVPGCFRALVLVGLNGWSGRAGYRGASSNYALISQIVDFANKWALDYHCYFDADSAGQSTAIEAGWLADVQAFTSWCAARGIRAFAGEYAFGTDPASLAAGAQFLAHLEANPNVWLGYTFWCGGGWTPYSYIFRLDPYGSRWDASNPDAASAATWAAPLVDRPQMAVLAKYLPQG